MSIESEAELNKIVDSRLVLWSENGSEFPRHSSNNWMPMSALSQAIPPAYSEFIGRQFLEAR